MVLQPTETVVSDFMSPPCDENQILDSSLFSKARAKTMRQKGKDGVIRVLRCDYSSRELSRSDVLDAHILKIFSVINEVAKGKEGLLAVHDKLNGHLLEHDGNCEGNRWHPLHPSYGQTSTGVTCVNIFTEGTNLQQMTVDLIVQPQLNDVYQEEKPMQTTVSAQARKSLTKMSLSLVRRIDMLSGYHSLSHVQHYWSTQPDMGVPLVYNTMSRNRFMELKKYIHFAGNQKLTKGDKMNLDALRNDGYPYHMSIYQGKDEQASKEPLGTRVVMKMVDFISANSAIHAHELYFDNFFTSYDLIVKLADNRMRATGTVRQNRVAGATASMLSDTALIKKTRGSFDYRSDGKFYVAKWDDNSGRSVVISISAFNSREKMVLATFCEHPKRSHSGSVANSLQSQAKVSYASGISTASGPVPPAR
ncbi:PiggyBac transposable element-derived protein 3 [Trichinella zimbabwensis]|uniref:PiggyBac transposable element-derived protein 3 n=1 Tax=Trichinella zimbabwensis TaxID=268475 RepID=A0A0V1H5U2_9BILA|nr:PiggyBac transposable element-derived protein 3 [Trichinella zimbabwensis]